MDKTDKEKKKVNALKNSVLTKKEIPVSAETNLSNSATLIESFEKKEMKESANSEGKDKKKTENTLSKRDTFIETLIKAYPKECVFYITSDKQPFLEKDKNLALMHQRGLGTEEKLQTVKVK